MSWRKCIIKSLNIFFQFKGRSHILKYFLQSLFVVVAVVMIFAIERLISNAVH